MIESAHFSAFVLSLLPKILFFSKFERSSVKEFLVLIWTLLYCLCFLLDLLENVPLLLRKLLELDVVQLVVVQKFAENNVEVRSGFSV